MPYQRILFQLTILAACVAVIFLVGVGAEAVCRATWLPGDTLWTLRHLAGLALTRLFALHDPATASCAPGGAAQTISALMAYAAPLLILLLVAQTLYEIMRHTLRRMYCVSRGGHALILGDADEVGPLVVREQAGGRILLLSRDAAAGQILRRRFWQVPVVAAGVAAPGLGKPGPGKSGLGMARARLVAAVSGSDVANLNLIEDLQATGGACEGQVVLRLESPVMRAAQAARGGAFREEISLDQGMFRRGAALGDPGARFFAGQRPAHIVLIGGDPGLGDLALHLAAFGYGLEHAPPLFTILGTGGAERSAAIERLRAAPYVVRIATAACDPADAVGLERTLARVLGEAPAPCAVHCVGGAPGEAYAMAMVAAATARSMTGTPPVVIAYGRAGFPAPHGAEKRGISYVACDDLVIAIAEKDRRDRMARAVHEAYLDLQRRTRGAAFGTLVAECDWADLPIAFRDDNRAVADHIDHMIRAVGLQRRPATQTPAIPGPDLIETMAAMAHARWLAGKVLSGWRYGAVRDDMARLHPGILPFEELPESEKDKDRDQIRAIPHILAILGEELGALSGADHV